MKVGRFILITITILSISSCDPNRIVDENTEIRNASWKAEDAKSFEFEIKDTSLTYNVMVNLRNNNKYPFSNVYLFVEMTSPSEKYFMDTLDYSLADKTGKWRGSGVGNIWLNRIPLVNGVKMKELGIYKVNIRHGMRSDSLQGISDVGLRVEKQ